MPDPAAIENPDHSTVREVYRERGWIAALFEALNKFGIYATWMGIFIGCTLFAVYVLFDKLDNEKVWIRDKLTGIVERDIESRRDTQEALKDFTKTADDLGEAIEDFTKVQAKLERETE